MSIFQRLQDALGIGEYEDTYDEEYRYEGESYPEVYPPQAPAGASRRRHPTTPNSNVVGMPGLPSGNPEVLLMEPRSFEEIPQAVRALKERKSVVLNLGLMEPEQAQRAADYVAGGAFAVDGHQERLGEHIFLFTPNNVQISSYSVPPPPPPPSATPVLAQPTPPGVSPWASTNFPIQPQGF
ncbi:MULTISPECIES: cell division protein SepF [unclassified Leptolyngbya]|uniref:cell division protein SepF n=1 Tax=unclassified Leptolyngbya TaxID=2650499 RepID=UPI0016863076|nr:MULTISPECIES: cell division protein SepF [unclassified Leptolyngbya]MBD1913024.1 cell division protein SepF [Leptolyngbya sp. FACHB-8]MBD2154475.1 cell division protein SepF [Leptolyngbya sp. FACHB-16]